MKLKVSWSDNAAGDGSALNQRNSKLRLWVLVTDELGQQIPEPLEVTAKLRDTRFIGWLRRVAPRRRGRRSMASAGSRGRAASGPWLDVTRPEPTRAEFLVRGESRRALPFWVRIRVQRNGAESEESEVFVIPFKNRVFSTIFVPCFALALAYSSWLWLTLTSDSVPGSFVAIAGTTWAVLGPFIAFAVPFFSATARRFAQDALISGSSALAALCLAIGIHHYQLPYYIENDTPGSIHAGSPQQPIVIPPGAAVVVPRSQLDEQWLKALPDLKQGKNSNLPDEHWFQSDSLCLRQTGGADGPGGLAPGNETATSRCLQLRPASLLTRLQSWIALGEKLQIGCTALQALDSDAIREWTKSGSCKHDQNLKVTRSLHDHLASVKLVNGPPTSCAEPNGSVVWQPFRIPSQPLNAVSLMRPVAIALDWPQLDGHASSEEIPSFHFTSSGRISSLDLDPAKDGDKPCQTAYPPSCPNDESKHCGTLYVPPTELSATLTLGTQKLGSLWCEMTPGRILGVRLHANVVTFNVVDPDGRPRSRYTSEAGVAGAWAAWCEPPPLSQNDRAQTPHLKAEVVLPRDWQPVEDWTWEVPAASVIRVLEISVQDHGHWGTLTCNAAPGVPLWLSLQSVTVPQSQAIGSAGDSGMFWKRYVESTLFPHWIWRCGASAIPSTSELEAKLDDKSFGKLSKGQYIASSGAACVIDLRSGNRLPGVAPPNAKDARAIDQLTKFPVAGCDTGRSVFALAAKQ